MLLWLAIGDAFGAGFEFADPAIVAQLNYPSIGYQPHPKGTIKAGRYTDDTQLTLGLLMYMMQDKRTPVALARAFVMAFKRDPRQGYDTRFYEFLKSVKNGTEFLQSIQPHSDRAGAAMRATPCGLLPTVEEALDLAVFQASITHATRDGMNSAAACAAMVWACRNGIDPGYLPTYLNDVVPGYHWEIPHVGPVGNRGIQVVRAAVTLVSNYQGDPNALLQEAVAFTGDVDTVACIAMAAASFLPQVVELEPILVHGLENGNFGKAYLEDLDAKLLAAFPVVPPPQEEPEEQVAILALTTDPEQMVMVDPMGDTELDNPLGELF